MSRPPGIAIVVEPRFPGGTSSAVAREVRVLRERFPVEVHGIASKMFGDRPPAGVLSRALDEARLPLRMNAPRIAADLVVLHNPSFLKFETALAPRIVARELVVVTHENLLRPSGFEPYDVAHTLRLIDRSSVALRKSLAPVSSYNRTTVMAWLALHPEFSHWTILEDDWINICDFEIKPPVDNPADRRGRHSRAGFEKFPSPEILDLCFPEHAEMNVILGADSLIRAGLQRPHWRMFPFKSIDLERYFGMMDFMVYYTAPTLRESFGRVLAEGVAAGKVVISDPDTASIFGGAVVAAAPGEVDRIIGEFIARPESYARHVAEAQAKLAAFSADAFLSRQASLFRRLERRAA